MSSSARKKIIAGILSLVILIIAGVFVISPQLTIRRPSPEEAIKAYLATVTKHYDLVSIQGPESNPPYTRYAVVADCSFWNASSQGRIDGKNVYFFDLTHSSNGWYVVAANGGP